MQEGKLPISKLMPLDLEHSFLAYLSACETAKGDLVEPDQTVHLAATMLFTGFKSVIGTMWYVDPTLIMCGILLMECDRLMRDDDGPTVAKVVYKQLFSQDSENLALDPDDVPYALDDAVRKLRETGCPPHRWAAFIHLGV
ncbi:hypothetical protein PHLCEN_2v8467 [Hermanssonia centrifuga]|uniref:CHAT domain-containing protein n=1 Tax=Hermanssonia centrifuga TaxID=98765 RepID=A0A2R6NTN0_9APHY|nr:hypothetical protein PHLCEN_2v8467 [Hermanssonia centrifuga]